MRYFSLKLHNLCITYTSNHFRVIYIFFYSAEIQGESLTVDFPEQMDWTGVLSEMELMSGDISGNLLDISMLLNKNM